MLTVFFSVIVDLHMYNGKFIIEGTHLFYSLKEKNPIFNTGNTVQIMIK